MTTSIFQAAARLLAASDNDDVIESGSDGHAEALRELAEAQFAMRELLAIAGVSVQARTKRAGRPVYFDMAGATDPKNADEFILRSVTDPRPEVSCMGRLVATGYTERVTGWFEDELNRGTAGDLVFQTLMGAQVQITASIVGNVLPPPLHQRMGENWAAMIARRFVDHAAAVAKARDGLLARKRAATE